MMRRLVAVPVVLAAVAPIAAEPLAHSLPSYPDMVGMFSRAAGRIDDASGRPLAQWAWRSDEEPDGCARLYWWDLTTSPPAIQYERFCVVGNWVRLMGWTTHGMADYLEIRLLDGTPGQVYAKVHAGGPYTVLVEAELWHNGQWVAAYTDFQSWAPVPGGWQQQEVFRWKEDIGAGAAFHAVATMRSRQMFATVQQTFIGWEGVVTVGLPAGTAETWTW